MAKLGNFCFANEFNQCLADTGHVAPQTFSVHPDLVIGELQKVQTDGNLHYSLIYGIATPFEGTYETGAEPSLFVCAGKQDDGVKWGEFYSLDGMFNGTVRYKHLWSATVQ